MSYSDAGPIKIQEEQKEENDETTDKVNIIYSLFIYFLFIKEPEDLPSSEDEGVWLLAQRKYDLFQKQYQDLLDPNLENEFEIMRRMGLPTMLINSYDDVEDVSVTSYCNIDCLIVCNKDCYSASPILYVIRIAIVHHLYCR